MTYATSTTYVSGGTRRLCGLAVIGAMLIAGCSSASPSASSLPTASPTTAVSSTPTTTPTASATTAQSPTTAQSAAPTSLDPCQLVTATEASSLAGASFAAGTEGTTSGGGRTCVYGAQTMNVFSVLVAQALDVATAQADWTQEEAQAQSYLEKGVPSGVTVSLNLTDVSNVAGADRAAVGTGGVTISGETINGSVIYLLKGAAFVYFGDLVLGKAAPATADMEAQATTTLGRVP
jgi:hypothetical protein